MIAEVLFALLVGALVIFYMRRRKSAVDPAAEFAVTLDADAERLRQEIAETSFEDWDILKNTPHLQAYKRTPLGKPFLSLRARVFIPNTTLGVACEYLWDISRRSSWDTNLSNFRILEKTDSGKDILYFTAPSSLPSVVPHREFVLERTKSQDGQTVYIVCKSAKKEELPVKEGHLRVEVPFSGYVLAPKDSGVWVDLVFHCDLKGRIVPTTLENLAKSKIIEWLEKYSNTCRNRQFN